MLNDPPYGSELSYNGLRLSKVVGNEDTKVTLFLLADSVVSARCYRGHKVQHHEKQLADRTLTADKVLVF